MDPKQIVRPTLDTVKRAEAEWRTSDWVRLSTA
jgi:hypothetical protein